MFSVLNGFTLWLREKDIYVNANLKYTLESKKIMHLSYIHRSHYYFQGIELIMGTVDEGTIHEK